MYLGAFVGPDADGRAQRAAPAAKLSLRSANTHVPVRPNVAIYKTAGITCLTYVVNRSRQGDGSRQGDLRTAQHRSLGLVCVRYA
eukprot:4102630-Pyramimonas_sp.AAC.2